MPARPGASSRPNPLETFLTIYTHRTITTYHPAQSLVTTSRCSTDYPLFGGSPSPAGSSAGSELGMGVPSGSYGGSPQAAGSDGVADDY